jgi:hypothetical protein
VLVLVAFASSSQGGTSEALSPSLKLECPTELDLGRAVEGQIVSAEIALKNEFDSAVKLQPIKASCSCLIAEVQVESKDGQKRILDLHEEPALPSGGRLIVRADLDTSRARGAFSQSIAIQQTDPPHDESMVVTLHVNVTPVVTFSPEILDLGTLTPGRSAKGIVEVTSNVLDEFTISVGDLDQHLHVEPRQADGVGRRWILECGVVDSLPVYDNYFFNVPIVLDSNSSDVPVKLPRVVYCAIRCRVVDPIYATPSPRGSPKSGQSGSPETRPVRMRVSGR